jgi:flagellar biosynthesis protein FlhB
MSDVQFPTDPNQYPEQSQATTILVLGILGLILFQPLAPFAWVMGNRELAAIDSGLRSPENRSTANTGRILGIIGTVLLGIGIVILVFVIVLLVFTVVANGA